VRAESAGPGQGSTFIVEMPRQPEPRAVSAQSSPVRACATPIRVLVIEDNRDSAESLKMVLTASGCQVRVAHTGTAGIRAATEETPDVVLCDIGLPGVDGYGVVSELRRNERTAGMRVIALTGYGSDEDRHRSKVAGFDLHLVKPVDPSMLRGLLVGSAPNRHD
jgi:CheY-like chemotaxis protein